MNANDLADRLEQFYLGTHIQKAAEELRRLQKENEELQEKLRKAQDK
jgi:predicted nuclease with TOPRIM domain